MARRDQASEQDLRSRFQGTAPQFAWWQELSQPAPSVKQDAKRPPFLPCMGGKVAPLSSDGYMVRLTRFQNSKRKTTPDNNRRRAFFSVEEVPLAQVTRHITRLNRLVGNFRVSSTSFGGCGNGRSRQSHQERAEPGEQSQQERAGLGRSRADRSRAAREEGVRRSDLGAASWAGLIESVEGRTVVLWTLPGIRRGQV